MKILVTGGNGLVGSAIKDVLNINNSVGGNTFRIGDDIWYFLDRKTQAWDLRNEHHVDTIFKNFEPGTVIHLAAAVGGLYMNLNSNYTMLSDNLKINMNIVDACRKYKVKRLINILSTCVFGNDLKYPLTSDQMYNKPPDSSNEGYSYSKRILDIGSKLLSKETGIEIVNIIPTNLMGFEDNFNLENSHVIPGLIHKCYNAKKDNTPLIIKGDGTALRTFLYASDLSKIIVHFINCELPNKFNQLICSPSMDNEISIKELVNKIIKEFDFNGEIVYDTSFSNGQHNKTTDSSELLEYIPDFKFTLLDIALKETIKYFIENYNTIRK
jgi:GDP-L-fucose synthase